MNINTQRMVCSFLSFIGAAGLIAFANPSSAAPIASKAPPQATMRYGDLDLRSSGGRAAFDRRVASVAHRVCSDGSPIAPPSEMSCRRDAIEKARHDAGLDDGAVRG